MEWLSKGSAIVQAVSRQLPIAVARVRELFRLCGICGVQRGTEAGFVAVLWFHLTTFSQIIPYSSSSHYPGLVQ
jgi:hypothetical protein